MDGVGGGGRRRDRGERRPAPRPPRVSRQGRRPGGNRLSGLTRALQAVRAAVTALAARRAGGGRTTSTHRPQRGARAAGAQPGRRTARCDVGELPAAGWAHLWGATTLWRPCACSHRLFSPPFSFSSESSSRDGATRLAPSHHHPARAYLCALGQRALCVKVVSGRQGCGEHRVAQHHRTACRGADHTTANDGDEPRDARLLENESRRAAAAAAGREAKKEAVRAGAAAPAPPRPAPAPPFTPTSGGSRPSASLMRPQRAA